MDTVVDLTQVSKPRPLAQYIRTLASRVRRQYVYDDTNNRTNSLNTINDSVGLHIVCTSRLFLIQLETEMINRSCTLSEIFPIITILSQLFVTRLSNFRDSFHIHLKRTSAGDT